ncbi:MAG: serine hydrolase domain-containing protein [Xenococcaceae cyanobacterium]
MPKHFSRRQFLKQGRAAIMGFSSFSLVSLGYNYSISKELKTNLSAEKIIANLEQQIPALMRKAVIPGLSLAIVRDGKLFWSKGFGVKNRNTKEPTNNNTVFAAASLSKPLFAYAVLKMYERGEIDLDTPLTEYTDKPYIRDSRLRLITARMVLCHTTGFPNWSGNAPVWIEATPGKRFGYSGEGYLYLQRVVEQITRQPLSEYIRWNLFAPLGMNSSSYIWEQEYEFLATDSHDHRGNPKPMRRPKEALSAGSLRTTATDFAQFLIAMMEPGTNYSPQLTQESLDEMLRQHVKINQSLDWGLGWALERTPDGDFFWHWGDGGTFKSFTLASRKLRTGIVILTNSQNGLRICKEIVRLSIGGQHPAFDFGMINY